MKRGICPSCLFVCSVICLVARAGDVPGPPTNLTSFQGKACIAKAEGRGAGAALSSCPNGTEKDGLLCYHWCSPGYHGVGPVCWKSCPNGTHDLGALCLKAYGKGCCCTVFGCCGGCRDGYRDFGCFCRKGFFKHSYGRGAGAPLRCHPSQEENGALCYKQCRAGYEGEGPVCWEVANPVHFPNRCNRVLYTTDVKTCDAIKSELIKTGTFTAACLALAVAAATTGSFGGLLMPAASFFCGKSFDSLVSQVEQILQLTHAKACTP